MHIHGGLDSILLIQYSVRIELGIDCTKIIPVKI